MSASPLSTETDRLLAWYDRCRRDLPWRAKPGQPADPYRVLLSEMMLQQTGVKTVAPYFARFLARWPDLAAFAAAEEAQVLAAWSGLGYYSRARNLHAAARRIAALGGFPEEAAELRALPGIGPYTAAAVAAIAFHRPEPVIDGNVERVMARMLALDVPPKRARARLEAELRARLPSDRPGDFAQAMMDLGATICTPRAPSCPRCPWQSMCRAAEKAAPEAFPVRLAKKARPVRYGIAHVVWRGQGVLLRSRPAKGLLADMAEVPTGAWVEAGEDASPAPPLTADWQRRNAEVRHAFSHFEIRLAIHAARVPEGTPAPAGCRWRAFDELDREALPTLMRKAIEAGRL